MGSWASRAVEDRSRILLTFCRILDRSRLLRCVKTVGDSPNTKQLLASSWRSKSVAASFTPAFLSIHLGGRWAYLKVSPWWEHFNQ